ncbi:hypothetical protein [Lysinibacillus telephonicus]|uniref:Uncharacterized protein n=1 Tax=Lysinibacillus telephonicus TaxID=1714840 RepID=A0A431UWK2_9BACI|nr:hypothetical protein [Lysinibacillus telephonicus]RTQ95435.1 hypothetical protein EKG35_03380 [Lysinibacillus telephonicus]
MKTILKILIPFVLIISIYGYNSEAASASTSETVFISGADYQVSDYINSSSSVYVLAKNTGSDPIFFLVVGPGLVAESKVYTLQPGAAWQGTIKTNSNTKHALALYCGGYKCNGTGNISLK